MDTSVWVAGAWASSTEQVSHFDGDGDEPAWIVEDATLPDGVSRFVEGMDGAVAVQTPMAVSRGGKLLGYIEAKVGRSRYTPSQRAKDWYIERFYGVTTTVVRRPR